MQRRSPEGAVHEAHAAGACVADPDFDWIFTFERHKLPAGDEQTHRLNRIHLHARLACIGPACGEMAIAGAIGSLDESPSDLRGEHKIVCRVFPIGSPENKRLEWILTLATAIGVAALLAPGLVVWNQFISVPADATEIEVVGQQWQWSFRLPGKDGRLGKADTRLVSAENPLGLIANDPNGNDDVVIEGADLHLPLGKPVKLLLRSNDVLHDFYVPQFRAKMDMVPGLVTYFWFTPTQPGKFGVFCAELCGVGHANMRGTVVVDDDGAYQNWLQKQRTFAELAAATES